jgi:hypothetical protein
VTPGVSQRILTVVGEEGIMKQQYHGPSYDATQTDKCEKYATITFNKSPFYGQKGRIVKKTAGRHPELQLEMPGGEKIGVDVLWTDYPITRPSRSSHHVDLEQANAIIQLLEYLKGKLPENVA